MTPQFLVVVVAAGSGLLGLWLCLRLRLAANSGLAAAACFAGAWFIPVLARPLLQFWLGHLPVGPAILVSVLPVLTATFVLVGAGLRYLAELVGHAVR